MLISITVLTFIAASVVSYVLSRPTAPLQILDHPNKRSLHNRPIPRTGGLAIWAGAVLGIVLAQVLLGTPSKFLWIAAGALLVGVVSFIDDWFQLSAGIRFASHLIAAGALMIGNLRIESIVLPGMALDFPPGLAWLLSLSFVVWTTNLYNFMDGMDGFAGGMGVIGFGAFSLLGWWAGDTQFAMVCAVVASATAGFLVFNFPPARIFMGDTGSSTLGLLAGACMLWADRAGIFPLWVGVLVFSPFIVDATVTLARRIFKGEKVWRAHKTHYYQRIVELGWGHRKTVLAEYVVMIGCAVSAIAGAMWLSHVAQWGLLIFWSAIYASIMLIVGRIELSENNKSRMR